MEKESGMGWDLWLTGLQPATCDRLHQEWAGPMAHLAGPASLAGSASGVRCARGAVTVAVAGVVAWAVRACRRHTCDKFTHGSTGKARCTRRTWRWRWNPIEEVVRQERGARSLVWRHSLVAVVLQQSSMAPRWSCSCRERM
jgi:hypothetical protein